MSYEPPEVGRGMRPVDQTTVELSKEAKAKLSAKTDAFDAMRSEGMIR